VLFVDLIEFTARFNGLDPEDSTMPPGLRAHKEVP
jgi:hypothetical protein